MRQHLFMGIVCSALFWSCSGNEQITEPNIPESSTDTVHIVQDSLLLPENPEEQLMQKDSGFEQSMNSFPKKWINIELKGNDLIYTKRCDMGDPQVIIEYKDQVWQLQTYYGTDGEWWQVINMTSREFEVDNQKLQEGTFVVSKITYPDDEIYEVSYFWNKTARFATFGEFFSKDLKFSPEENRPDFVIKHEKCN